MRTWMRRPEKVRLDLGDGYWLDVKKHLTAGEHRSMLAGMMREDQESISSVKVGMSQILAYLLDWSITDLDGKVVAIAGQPQNVVEGAVNALDVDGFRDILTAIQSHAEAMKLERAAEKNAPATVSAS